MLGFEQNGYLASLLLEHIPVCLAVFDSKMRYLACSKRWLTDRQIGNRQIIGQSHYEVFPEVSDTWRALHSRVLSGETFSNHLEAFHRSDGIVEWIEWEMMPWHEPSGEIGGAIMIAKVRNEIIYENYPKIILKSELDILLNSAKEYALILIDESGKICTWNNGGERIFGWKSEEAIGKYFDFLFTAEDCALGIPQQELENMCSHAATQTQGWRVKKNGARFMVEAKASAIFEKGSSPQWFGVVIRDLTKQIENQNIIESKTSYLSAIVNNLPEAMVTIDEDGYIGSFNENAEKMFGYLEEELIGRNIKILMDEPDASNHDRYIENYKKNGERHMIGFSRRVIGKRKDGTKFPHEIRVGEAEVGGKRFFIGFLRDLTQGEVARIELDNLQDELAHMSRVTAVGSMATALAHEINQPLTAIANYVQAAALLMPEGGNDDLVAVKHALNEAGKEALRAGSIIQRLRQFVSRGDIDRTMASPRELARQALELGATGSAERGVRCINAVSRNVGLVLVDKVQIQQVLVNLIRNAIEALVDGGVIIVTAREELGMVHFTVSDDGPGMGLSQAEALFEPFVTTKPYGMGLGLTICRTIIEAHQGRIWCETGAGKGATFHFTVPLAEGDDAR